MHNTHIKGTNLHPSSLCLGTGDMGAGITREYSYHLLDIFIEAGGNFLDSAKVYSDWIPGERSRSEKVIGEWMKLRNNRSQVIVATKGAHFYLETPQEPRVSPEEIQSDLDASLKHLQTDFIDLYWLHRDDPLRPIFEIIDTLENAVKSGKIRYYGLSNWRLDRIIQAQSYAAEKSYQGFSGIQNLWNLAAINENGMPDPTMVAMDSELWEYHKGQQVTAIPYSSQANGIFQKLASGPLDTLPNSLRKMYMNPTTERRAHKVSHLSQDSGLTITQVVVGYLLSQPFTTIPIFSTGNEAHLLDTLRASDVHLDAEQVAFLLAE